MFRCRLAGRHHPAIFIANSPHRPMANPFRISIASALYLGSTWTPCTSYYFYLHPYLFREGDG
jgi:hypothetical protein